MKFRVLVQNPSHSLYKNKVVEIREGFLCTEHDETHQQYGMLVEHERASIYGTYLSIGTHVRGWDVKMRTDDIMDLLREHSR